MRSLLSLPIIAVAIGTGNAAGRAHSKLHSRESLKRLLKDETCRKEVSPDSIIWVSARTSSAEEGAPPYDVGSRLYSPRRLKFDRTNRVMHRSKRIQVLRAEQSGSRPQVGEYVIEARLLPSLDLSKRGHPLGSGSASLETALSSVSSFVPARS
jgi:hypothetical protein